MRQTLFYIPYEIFGLPTFGLLFLGWLLGIGISAWVFWQKNHTWTRENSTTLLLSLATGVALCWGLPAVGRPAGIPVQGYGVMMLLAVLLSGGLAMKRAKQFGFRPENVFEICFWLVIPGLIGARLFYVVEYWNEIYSPNFLQLVWNILNFPEGGLVVYGSFFGGLAGGLYYLWSRHLSVLRMLDLLAPSMVLGLALGRIGCFLNGCCFGGVCPAEQAAWGVHFPAGSPPYQRQVYEGKLIPNPHDFYYGMRFDYQIGQNGSAEIVVAEVQPESIAAKKDVRAGDVVVTLQGDVPLELNSMLYELVTQTRWTGCIVMTLSRQGQEIERRWCTVCAPGPVSLPVYPTQLYSSANAFCLFVLLLIYSFWRQNPKGVGMRRDGEVFAWLITLYPITRFILEMIRTDETDFLHTGMSISQNISIVLFCFAILFWIYLWRRTSSAKPL